ncbi:pseudouridine synthase [Roseivirga misakiensis]|uniref:Pseudouridine synthase n=1 Tax=Roseivirga misakiensis TaxID=1563681 RepID=A0A1E5T647_9BACT|nr:pseudouridine synthase [Roseivirga misakiensis]OEK06845.1 pseudouridine synthase [Roseivirga misakiensis]
MQRKKFSPKGNRSKKKAVEKPDYQSAKLQTTSEKADGIRLNKYIANSGVCSRREADKLIQSGQITADKEVITALGYKVKPGVVIRYNGRVLKPEKQVYLLLNKPKGFITTTSDPEGRRTVMDLVNNACGEKIFPVGRLDRVTTGLLLFTNDGELAKKLTLPTHKIKKIYQVELNKPITKRDFESIVGGVTLEDGKALVEDLAIVSDDGRVLGIEIHIGKNRIVRRIFEHLGYQVEKLDRVAYGQLTKKDLPRGNWRFLTEKEALWLK